MTENDGIYRAPLSGSSSSAGTFSGDITLRFTQNYTQKPL